MNHRISFIFPSTMDSEKSFHALTSKKTIHKLIICLHLFFGDSVATFISFIPTILMIKINLESENTLTKKWLEGQAPKYSATLPRLKSRVRIPSPAPRIPTNLLFCLLSFFKTFLILHACCDQSVTELNACISHKDFNWFPKVVVQASYGGTILLYI